MFVSLTWISLVAYMTGGMFCGYKTTNCGASTTEYWIYGYGVYFLLIALFAFKVRSSQVPLVTKIILFSPVLPFLHLAYIALWFLTH